MQTPIPTLETERLILRAPKPEDFDAWADFMADPEASKYLGGAVVRPAAWRSMCTMAGAWIVRGFSMFAVEEKATGRWVGRLGPWQPEAWPGTEVGWGIVRDCWGKGYATEGAAAAIDWAFDTLGWTEVIHCIDEDNEPSKAVARRLGSRHLRDAITPPPLEWPVQVWGQSREAWLARRR